jgi:hypothetical protein
MTREPFRIVKKTIEPIVFYKETDPPFFGAFRDEVALADTRRENVAARDPRVADRKTQASGTNVSQAATDGSFRRIGSFPVAGGRTSVGHGLLQRTTRGGLSGMFKVHWRCGVEVAGAVSPYRP